MTGRSRKREVVCRQRSTGKHLGVFCIPVRDGNGNDINMEDAAQAVTKEVARRHSIPLHDMYTTFTKEV